jgi:hypothetical protein
MTGPEQELLFFAYSGNRIIRRWVHSGPIEELKNWTINCTYERG